MLCMSVHVTDPKVANDKAKALVTIFSLKVFGILSVSCVHVSLSHYTRTGGNKVVSERY